MLVAVLVVSYVALYIYVSQSDAYAAALTFLESREEIRSNLGQPTSFRLAYMGWMLSFSGPKGTASFQVYVWGPKGSGSAFVEQTRRVGKWEVAEANLVMKGGQIISLQKRQENPR